MLYEIHPLLQQLQPYCGAFQQGHIDSRRYLSHIAQVLRQHLECDQVSAWRLKGSRASMTATCLTRSQRGFDNKLPADIDMGQAHQAYFQRLLVQGCVASSDTWVDPALDAVRSRYLEVGAPRALLDVAFTVNGRTFGILCCEELSATRSWTPEEQALLRRVGGRVALQIKANEDRLLAQRAEESPVALRWANAAFAGSR
jgi:GAF domain-containing protein